MESKELKNIRESYNLRHKESISKQVPSTHVRVFPLKGPRKPETKQEPQRFEMSTPPVGPPGLDRA